MNIRPSPGNSTPTAIELASFTAEPDGDAVRLTWETASELDNVGFNLYRADDLEGPWTQLNATLIPSQSPGSVFGATYTWLDETVVPNQKYFYRLEDVDTGGTASLSEIVSASLASRTDGGQRARDGRAERHRDAAVRVNVWARRERALVKASSPVKYAVSVQPSAISLCVKSMMARVIAVIPALN